MNHEDDAKSAKNSKMSGFFADNPLFQDLSRMAGNAFGSVAGMRQEVEVRIKEAVENFAGKLDMVKREEFEVVKQMASSARMEQENLKARIAELEKKLMEKDDAKKAKAKE